MTCLKKMPAIVDKTLITKVCVDDFALRKRYTYGTVMVNLESHRIIDIIESRETKAVENWLKTYPNLQVISRDGAQTYSSAATNSHPDAIQVSDRFHLLKNLSEAAEKFMRRLYPSRLVIPSTTVQSAEMQMLYNTRNRSERIQYAQKKRSEGYTITDIALLLHSSTTTINRYLAIPENEIPESRENIMERKHMGQMEKKKTAIEEVRKLYSQGQTIEAVSRLTGHTWKTVTNYLKEDCPLNNGHYDQRMPGKLAPYEKAVIDMRSKGITYIKIHEYITEKGYTGTVASLRVFMQKERAHQQSIGKQSAEPVEYIPRKFMSQLIYRKIEEIKGLTQEQYESALKKYPVLADLYAVLKEFHRMVFSQKGDELDTWIETAGNLQIEEIDSYLGGLKKDLSAVKNGINYEYNNGLAEGSVNKIKLTKRIMYGRNSFLLLKAKLLLNEYYYQIN